MIEDTGVFSATSEYLGSTWYCLFPIKDQTRYWPWISSILLDSIADPRISCPASTWSTPLVHYQWCIAGSVRPLRKTGRSSKVGMHMHVHKLEQTCTEL